MEVPMRPLRGSLTLAIVFALIGLAVQPAAAASFTLTNGGSHTTTASGGSLAASAQFSLNAGTLTVVLTNTSASDVLVPADVLTGVYFNLTGNPSLASGSAVLTGGSTVLFDSAP